MTRRRRHLRLGLSVLPLCGAVVFGYGLVLRQRTPSFAELTRVETQRTELRAELHRLQAIVPPSEHALVDRLPRQVTVGELLERLERAARTAAVKAVSFGSDVQTDTATPTEDDAAISVDVPKEPEGDPLAAGPRPDVLRCQITLEAEFAALVRFLGLVEESTAVTRVRGFEIAPLASGVRATVNLAAYAYAGDGREAEPVQAQTEAPR